MILVSHTSTFANNLCNKFKGYSGNDDEEEQEAPSDSDGSVAVTDDMIIQSLLEAGQDLSLRVLKPSMDLKMQTYKSTCVKIIMSLIGTTMREELLRFRHGEPSAVPPCENLLPLQWHAGLARLACSTGSTWFEASVVVKALLSRLSWGSQKDHEDTELPPYTDSNDIVVSLEDKSDLEKDLIYEFRLLDAFLELEHSDECEMAIFESPKSIEEEGNDGEELTDGESKEASKVDGGSEAQSSPPKPSPSFRIAGRQFPVQKLEAYSTALISMVTNGNLGVLKTRKDFICDAAITLWSPYCDAMLHAIDDILEEDLPIDQRLIKVLLDVLTTIHIALDRCDADDPILRGRVCLRLTLLLEQESELRDAVQIIRHGLKTIEAHRASRWNANIKPFDEHERDALSMSSICTVIDQGLFDWSTTEEEAKQNRDKRLVGLGSIIEPFDQDLAALHTDLILAMHRVELALGSDINTKSKRHKRRLKLLRERNWPKSCCWRCISTPRKNSS